MITWFPVGIAVVALFFAICLIRRRELVRMVIQSWVGNPPPSCKEGDVQVFFLTACGILDRLTFKQFRSLKWSKDTQQVVLFTIQREQGKPPRWLGLGWYDKKSWRVGYMEGGIYVYLQDSHGSSLSLRVSSLDKEDEFNYAEILRFVARYDCVCHFALEAVTVRMPVLLDQLEEQPESEELNFSWRRLIVDINQIHSDKINRDSLRELVVQTMRKRFPLPADFNPLH